MRQSNVYYDNYTGTFLLQLNCYHDCLAQMCTTTCILMQTHIHMYRHMCTARTSYILYVLGTVLDRLLPAAISLKTHVQKQYSRTYMELYGMSVVYLGAIWDTSSRQPQGKCQVFHATYHSLISTATDCVN